MFFSRSRKTAAATAQPKADLATTLSAWTLTQAQTDNAPRAAKAPAHFDAILNDCIKGFDLWDEGERK